MQGKGLITTHAHTQHTHYTPHGQQYKITMEKIRVIGSGLPKAAGYANAPVERDKIVCPKDTH